MESIGKNIGKMNKNRLEFTVSLAGKPDQDLNITAYAFDRRGRLLNTAPVSLEGRDGRFALDLPAKTAPQARIFLAPTPTKEQRNPRITLEQMQRWQAYEPTWRYISDQALYPLLPIPELNWHWWWWCSCRVRGRVVRPVTIQGITYQMPVCHARVHICEVDRLPLIIWQLPERDLWRLRDELLPLLEQPPIRWPIPEPDPAPFVFDPRTTDPSPINVAALNQANLTARLESLGKMAGFDPQPEPPQSALRQMQTMAMAQAEQPTVHLNRLMADLHPALQSRSVQLVRQTLVDNYQLLLPYLCWLDWLWTIIRCDELAVLETDANGRFDTDIWYLCFGDKPDLYFWVEYNIGSVWTTVYHPPMRCHTFWNYVCSTEVTIQISDPRVGWCDPAPRVNGNQLAILGIGESISVRQIETSGTDRGLTKGNADPNGSTPGGTIPGSPFGGVLEPRVIFGEDLVDNGITHYRWSYRRLTDPQGNAVTDLWHAMDTEVVRHYAYTKPDNSLAVKPYLLGPDTDPALTVGGLNLFQIQPDTPPQGQWAPQVNAHQNTASAFFPTHLLSGGDASASAGKYELKLELFDTHGNRIVFNDGINPPRVRPVVPEDNAPFGPVDLEFDPAPAVNLLMQGSQVVGFRMTVHVDNNPCQAVIYPVQVGPNAAGPCGFIPFANTGQTVRIAFRAAHENDFATFDFSIFRGSVGEVEGANGRVGQTVGNYIESSGDYLNTAVTVGDLLGSCPRAAFAETLYVAAMATDGWHRLTYLDRHATPLAFALAPAA